MVTEGLNPGGAQRILWHLASSLHQEGLAQVEIQHSPSPGASWEGDFARQGIPLHAADRGRYSLRRLARLARLVRQGDFQILHSHTLDCLRYCLTLRGLLPGRFQVVHTQSMRVSLREHPTYALWQRWLAPRAGALCVVSPGLQEEYARLGVKAGQVIPPGVEMDPPPGPPPGLAKAQLVRDLGLTADPQALWLLNLARLEPIKGQRGLLRLWSEMDPTLRSRLWLFLVGPEETPGERARLQAAVQGLERVTLVPGSPHPDLWLQAADAAVSASESEGLPLTALEAVAQGTPLLLSDIPGHRCLRSVAGFFPVPVNQTSLRAVTRWLRSTLEDPAGTRQRLREQAASLRQEFTARQAAHAYGKVYQSLCG